MVRTTVWGLAVVAALVGLVTVTGAGQLVGAVDDALPGPGSDRAVQNPDRRTELVGDEQSEEERREERRRRRRRPKREEWGHEKSDQHFLGPDRWNWHDPPSHFTVNKLCYPPDAKTYMPSVILRIKPLDEGVTFPMIVDYAEYRLNKLIDVDEVLEDEAVEIHFENQGAHLLHVKGETRGLPVECRQIVYLRGQWFTVVACCATQHSFAENVEAFDSFIESINVVDGEAAEGGDEG